MNRMLLSPTSSNLLEVGNDDLRPQLVWPLIQLLNELARVIGRLSDGQYVQKPVGVIESSVGGHVRHCLDHVQSLLSAIATSHLDYENRQRGTAVERVRICSLQLIDELTSALRLLPRSVLARPLRVSVSMSSDDEPVSVLSSVGREMAYVLSHTIHHNAIVGAMVKTLGGAVPDRFGYAPSTIKNMEKARCAPSALSA